MAPPCCPRRATRGAIVGASIAVAGALLAREAIASPSARLVYSRSPEVSSCPGEGAMRSAVAARFGYDPFFPWAKQTVIVQLSRRHSKYLARIQLLDEAGIAHGAREITSDQSDCAEIFDAAALAVSIALDAAAKASPSADASSPQPAPPPSPPPSSEAKPQPPPVAEAPRPVVPAKGEPAKPDAPPSEHPAASAGIDLLGSVGTSPALAPALALFGRVSMDAWSVSLDLRAEAGETESRPPTQGGGRVESALYVGSVVPCLHRWYFAVCAVAAAGIEVGSGRDITPQSSKTTLYAAAGGRLEFEWPISPTLGLRVRGETVANLHRATLVLGEDSVWPAPAVAGNVGAGAVVRFR